ncbi:MAG: alpha/beta hydrolase [Acidimicrobiales bacterium]
MLRSLAIQESDIGPDLRHVEVYTMGGLLSLLWHGESGANGMVITGGGAMGSLLGPAGGLFHDLAVELWSDHGIGTIRVGYRQPNNLEECVLDLCAAADLAVRAGSERFIAMGHSFGGAVAVGAGIALPEYVAGVVTLATQSAGCEQAELLHPRPILLFHGDRDELLPVMCSEVVSELAGGGEVVILPGTGHLLSEAGDEIRSRLRQWIPATLATPAPSASA